MVFKNYKFGCWKKEIREILRDKLKFNAKLRYHKMKIEKHKIKIRELNKIIIPKLDKDLNYFLKKAGN